MATGRWDGAVAERSRQVRMTYDTIRTQRLDLSNRARAAASSPPLSPPNQTDASKNLSPVR